MKHWETWRGLASFTTCYRSVVASSRFSEGFARWSVTCRDFLWVSHLSKKLEPPAVVTAWMCYVAGSNKLESHFERKKKLSFLQLLLLRIKSFCKLRQLTVKRFKVHGGTILQIFFFFNSALDEKLWSALYFELFTGKIPKCEEYFASLPLVWLCWRRRNTSPSVNRIQVIHPTFGR
jgi:hypothetical protein